MEGWTLIDTDDPSSYHPYDEEYDLSAWDATRDEELDFGRYS